MKNPIVILVTLALLPTLGWAQEAHHVIETQSVSPIDQLAAFAEPTKDSPIQRHTRAEWQQRQHALDLLGSDAFGYLMAGPDASLADENVTCVVDCHDGTMISCTGQVCMVYDDGSGCNATDCGTTYEGSC